MEDYSLPGVPEALLPKRSGPLKMEELALTALLECPLCFEQLDASAKVLPCQHTFCKSCLQRQEAAHCQLLCPECRAPVPVRTVEELPANLLLVRLLEGLQGPPGSSRNRQTARYAVPSSRGGLTVREGQHQQASQHREKQGHSELALRASRRNSITPKGKADENRHDGNAGDSSSVSAAASTLLTVNQMPQLKPLQQSQPPALCRALCDFNPEEMNLEDSKCCLSFLKVWPSNY